MSKIFNYILNGKGLGVKFLLILSVIMAIIFTITIKIMGTQLIPYAQSVADQLLPLKIENGIVVEPVDTVRIASIKLNQSSSSDNFPIVIDTREDQLDTNNLKQGIYLSRTTIYMINPNEVRMKKLDGSFNLPQGDYTEAFKSLLNWTVIFSCVLFAVGIFVFYFLLCLFYAWCSYAVSGIASKKYNFDQRMRLSTLCFTVAYLAFIPLDLLIRTGSLVFFIVVIFMQGFMISKMPSGIIIADTSKPEPEETAPKE